MIEKGKYMQLKDISVRTYYNHVEQKKIFPTVVEGVTYVIDPSVAMSDQAQKALKLEAVKELETLAMRGNALRPKEIPEGKRFRSKEINKIVADMQDVVAKWVRIGVQLRGWSKAACYRKIEDLSKLSRQRRSDLFERKQEQLKKDDVYEKLKSLYAKAYFDNYEKKPSLREITKQIQMYAQSKEEFYELAAVPFSTLYDNVQKLKERYAHELVHQYYNNHSHLLRNRAYVDGAFTADIKFMEWFSIDDHVMEVDGALVWNETKRMFEKKKVYLWMIVEVKTLFPVAYHIQANNFNADELKYLMMQSLMNMGAPVKGILMDNGLAASKKCQDFLDRLGILHDSGEAYDWMHKAVQERSFGFIKKEFCSQWANYIGGGRTEVRHASRKMSPEETTFTVQEFIKQFDDYVEGWYQTKERDRTDNFEKVKISIRADFENRYMTYDKIPVNPVKLRFCFCETKLAKMSLQHLTLGDRGLYTPDIGNVLDPVLQNRNYQCYYNPLDDSEIDIYACDDILIQKTGEYYNRGDYVCTLYRQRGKMPEQKRKEVAVLNNKNFKRIKEYVQDTVDIAIAENFHAFAPELNEKGQLIDTRTQLLDKATEIMQDAEMKVKEVLIPETKKRGRKPSEEAQLSDDELNGLNSIVERGEYD